MADDKSSSFEASLQRLEQIVRTLETGDVDLEKSVELYNAGRDLIASCETMLATAHKQLESADAARNGDRGGDDGVER